ncbi:hypothetical protein [Rhodanobacter lindaniclasticus]
MCPCQPEGGASKSGGTATGANLAKGVAVNRCTQGVGIAHLRLRRLPRGVHFGQLGFQTGCDAALFVE